LLALFSQTYNKKDRFKGGLDVGVVQNEILRINPLIFNNLQRCSKNHRAKNFFLFFVFFFQVSQDI